MLKHKSKIHIPLRAQQSILQSAFSLYVKQRFHATSKTTAKSTEMMITNL